MGKRRRGGGREKKIKYIDKEMIIHRKKRKE